MRVARFLTALALSTSLIAGCGGDDTRLLSDAGRPLDAGSRDASASDAGAFDAGAFDAGEPSDASASDAGAADGGGPVDAGAGTRIDSLVARIADPAATAADGDAVLAEVAFAEGWPVAEAGRWLFATRWDDTPGDVAFVSDVNAWAPLAAPATHAAGTGLWWVVVDESTFAVPAVGAKYKWYGRGDVYRAPPEATAYGFDAFHEHGWVRPPTTAPHLERFPAFHSTHVGPDRALRAWLPAGFVARSTGAAAMRTLLLHDGQNVFDPDSTWGGWHVDDTLVSAGYTDVVALAVDSVSDRFDAYTHVADDIGSGALVGGRADDYLAMLHDEVLPFFRARYGIVATGRSLMVMGSSLGGLVSLYQAMTAPSDQACVAAMSSTLGWGAFAPALSGMDALVRRWAGHGATAIYLDSGGSVTGTCNDPDGDGVFEDSTDLDSYCATVQMRDRLATLGYAFGTDLTHWWEPGAMHNEAAWAARVDRALTACSASGWVAP